MTPRNILRLAGIALFAAGLYAGEPVRPGRSPSATPEFSPERFMQHVRYLADDARGGRGTGSPGVKAAGDYIAQRLAEFGCAPAGDDGTFFQEFQTMPANRLDDEAALFEIEGDERAWKLREDWVPMPFSAPGVIRGPVAFVGYGIEATKYGYDDYAGFSAAGKVLLMLRYEPPADEPGAEFGGKRRSKHANFSSKVGAAERHGAKALLIVDPPTTARAGEELYPFALFTNTSPMALPILHVSRELADTLLARAGEPDISELEREINADRKPASRNLRGVRVAIDQGLTHGKTPARNVLGLLAGAGDTAETIVVGAHYDHLGWRVCNRLGGQAVIHNGADDNASGTAGILEIARAVSDGPRPRRNTLFIAFGAEEIGLLGSRHFVGHPTIPLDDIQAMINLDMIGQLYGRRVKIHMEPRGRVMKRLLRAASTSAGLPYSRLSGMWGSSDHAPFQSEGIPVIFAFSGLHAQYHQPEDDWELIDPQGATKIITMLHEVTWELANLAEGPRRETPLGE